MLDESHLDGLAAPAASLDQRQVALVGGEHVALAQRGPAGRSVNRQPGPRDRAAAPHTPRDELAHDPPDRVGGLKLALPEATAAELPASSVRRCRRAARERPVETERPYVAQAVQPAIVSPTA